ncbi:uridine kinase [Priestia megaterium]|nr:uridine kinase [Priestia megaterium]
MHEQGARLLVLTLNGFYQKLLLYKKSDVFLIGIDGCGGSGKSTLAKEIANVSDGVFVHIDDFYHPSSEQEKHRKEIGGMFDWRRLRDQVCMPLANKQTAHYQRYDWPSDSLKEWHEIQPKGTIVIEGISATRDELTSFYDVLIFVDTPYDVRLRRGIERDGEEMRSMWVDVWMPAEELYMKAQAPMARANFVVDGSGENGDITEGVIVLKDSN